MERTKSSCVWVEIAGPVFPEVVVLDSAAHQGEVTVSLAVCSDKGHPVLLEQLSLQLPGGYAYEQTITASDAEALAANRALEACGRHDFGEITIGVNVQRKDDATDAEAQHRFRLCAIAEWRSEGEMCESRPAILQEYEPQLGADADAGLTFTPLDD